MHPWWLSPQTLNGFLALLQRRGVRIGALLMAVPLTMLGRWVLPGDLPPGTLPELLAGDLGAVAAGLFLSFVGILAAAAYTTGTVAFLAGGPNVRPFAALGMLLTGLAALTVTLYLAGRALTWAVAFWLLVVAGGSLWGIGQLFAGSAGTPPADEPYDPTGGSGL